MNWMQGLIELPSDGIYALVNEKDKKVYISMSKNLINQVTGVIRKWNYSNIEDVVFVSLERYSNTNMRLRRQYWIDRYSNMGYTHYVTYSKIQYKVLIDIMSIRTSRSRSDYLFRVNLTSRGNRKVTVGLFDNVEDMNEFVNKYYSSNIYNVVYADNNITKEYLR